MKRFRKSASPDKLSGQSLWNRKTSPLPDLLVLILLAAFLVPYVLSEPLQKALLGLLYPGEKILVHSRLQLSGMTGVHLRLTLGATSLSALCGILLGVGITRTRGRAFYNLVMRTNSFIQTLPPSAVIILAFPLLGFGWKPALLALFLYSLFPVLGNTVVGFESIDASIRDAAKGMGMTGLQQMWLAEFPPALPFILTGIRHSLILNLGTAAIAAVIGGGGLGTIIISGLTLRNSALVFSGTLVIVLLAFMGETLFRVAAKMNDRKN